MSSIIIYFVSKDDQFKLSDADIAQFFADNDQYVGKVKVFKIKDNTTPLTKLYNSLIDNIYDDKLDCIVFMHADVKLDLAHLVKRIDECKDKYDAFGLCGCSKIQLSQSPLNWWCGSRPFPNSRWGCVTHGELGNQTSFFSSHSPDVYDASVACIDGLCIGMYKSAIDKGIRFDEQFAFDFYDTDFSLQCVMNNALRLGVIVEKSLYHYSVGKSILTNDFLNKELLFRKKWNLNIPAGSKLEQLLKQNTST